jgi:hypothetical protein
MRRNYSRCWLLALSLLAGLAGTVQAQARFSYSSNGSEVTDSKTGLVWQRCSAGQSWSGSTCTGTATTYTHEAALTYAQTQTGWRLPNVKELASLVDRTVTIPSIDSVAFPATAVNHYWSASPYVGDADFAWIVGFNGGDIHHSFNRSNVVQVRLVR